MVWDKKAESAFAAYVDYSRVSTTNWPALRSALDAVLATACDDPMILYMAVRYPATSQSDEEAVLEYEQVHEEMVKSRHHPVFKFFAGWRTEQAMHKLRIQVDRQLHLGQTMADLEDLARDTNAPIDEVFDAAFTWLEVSRSKGWIDHCMEHLDPILRQNWNDTEQMYRLEGDAEVWRAWAERGGGWANSVTEEGWKGFAKHLEEADNLLTRSWELNPSNANTAYLMMQVELGQGRGRSRMERWFNRAMSLNTNYFDAVTLMSFYLEPRWYGSEHDTLAFARSCVASSMWGGQVPLVLANVHHSLATYLNLSNSPAYWQRPEVWPDVKASYERFFALNPEEVGWRQHYALDAYNCGQYSVFLRQIKMFSGGTNFAFFGGSERFQEMVRRAASEVPPRSNGN